MQSCQIHSSVRDTLTLVHDRFEKADLFFGHGTDNAWDEAAWLVAHIIGAGNQDLNDFTEKHLSQKERQQLDEIVEQRCRQQTPLAYILKETWFAGVPFYIDERALVPRSYIGEWIEGGFSPWVDMSTVCTVLDLCTGSGCIAAAVALEFPHCQVIAADISADALEVAAINIDRHKLNERVTLIDSDLFDQIPDIHFDLILCNPPYVSDELMKNLPREYLQEPELALRADNDGTEIIEQILDKASRFLSPQGHIIIETASATDAIARRHPHSPFTWLSAANGETPLILLSREELSKITIPR